MQGRCHENTTRHVLGPYFDSDALEEVVAANLGQDSLLSIFGNAPFRHFCDRAIEKSVDYVESEHALIVNLAGQPGTEREQRTALGRLLHAVQDFYAHSNYVDLWLDAIPDAPRRRVGCGESSLAAPSPAPPRSRGPSAGLRGGGRLQRARPLEAAQRPPRASLRDFLDVAFPADGGFRLPRAGRGVPTVAKRLGRGPRGDIVVVDHGPACPPRSQRHRAPGRSVRHRCLGVGHHP